MHKIAKRYIETKPYQIVERGFHPDKAQVSESLFSLGNEYCGVRAFFDETYSAEQLVGTYFNGIYDYALSDTPNAYLGIVKRTHFTINSVNFFKIKVFHQDEELDLAKVDFDQFERSLDFRNGLYSRQFEWYSKGVNISVKIERLLDMTDCHNAAQRITFLADSDVDLKLQLFLDSNILHWQSNCYWQKGKEFRLNGTAGLFVKTLTTNQTLTSVMKTDVKEDEIHLGEKEVCATYNLKLKKNEEKQITRYVVNIVDKKGENDLNDQIDLAIKEVSGLSSISFADLVKKNEDYFNAFYNKSDIVISGSDLDQQGIRYCLFQLTQAYHGFDSENTIGAKGLTGEAYSGHAFWDNETYCLPFYLFSNQQAAKNLIMFRYNTLAFAKERAKDLDCEGACFPVATRNGKEGCNLWQHASLQLQPSTAVYFAIYHYMKIYNDHEFMQEYGIELLIEIAKFLLSRGQYNNDNTKFSYYGVMGPDEFQMMVNHNTYTNFMAKKCFEYLNDIIASGEYQTKELLEKCGFTDKHLEKMQDSIKKMVILYDPKTLLFEQNAGFFDMPHIDIKSIKDEEMPLYSHWTYDRIYRNDIIKQPDVLMFMFLYMDEFSNEQLEANYYYYEPKTLHESSLSPSIHSIIASKIRHFEDAYNFFGFATRLDLDDYNNNTKEGIHMTSIAAAWMNIVYGFGGLIVKDDRICLNPIGNQSWDYYQFKLNYKGHLLKIKVDKQLVTITKETNEELIIDVYEKTYNLKNKLEIKRA